MKRRANEDVFVLDPEHGVALELQQRGDEKKLSDALHKLTAEDPAKAELVKLRFFAGLTIREAAALLGVSSRTANEYWSYAKAWLMREIEGPH